MDARPALKGAERVHGESHWGGEGQRSIDL